ncbi:MAG: uroporphyrinogen decarboxylase [Gemmatimonadetes bacterium]|nr:uroporphyrinogen decarboxylase [Gemmatimonadota bacterium]
MAGAPPAPRRRSGGREPERARPERRSGGRAGRHFLHSPVGTAAKSLPSRSRITGFRRSPSSGRARTAFLGGWVLRVGNQRSGADHRGERGAEPPVEPSLSARRLRAAASLPTIPASAPTVNDRLLRALRREPVDRTPIWLMRQAGRSLPRYREMRDERPFFDVLRDPEASAKITAMPLDYYPLDAAVLYNDLATPFLAAGFQLELRKGVGPVVDRPIRSAADVDALKPFEPREALKFNLDAIRILVEQLDVPVLGFVGAPFTLCSYLVGGPRSRELSEIKRFLWEQPEAWARLATYWADHLAEFCIAQHEAGAAAVQVFDSWAGSLSLEDYRDSVLPWSRRLIDRVRAAGVPVIHYFGGNPALLEAVAEAGGDAVSVDWRVPLDDAWRRIGYDRAIQGNLDPLALLAGKDVAVAKARDVLMRAEGRPGHVFNLGHGIHPETDHHVVAAVVEAVQSFDLEEARSQRGQAEARA